MKEADRWDKFNVMELRALLWAIERSGPPNASIADELGTEIDAALRRQGAAVWPPEDRSCVDPKPR